MAFIVLVLNEMVLVLEKQRWCTGASSTSTVALSTASLSTSTSGRILARLDARTFIYVIPCILTLPLGQLQAPRASTPSAGGVNHRYEAPSYTLSGITNDLRPRRLRNFSASGSSISVCLIGSNFKGRESR